jgi:RimJ/RimL family protein N-acetyltransferase
MDNLLQPAHLSNDIVHLIPLRPEDREALYPVAADPLIWEQHPNPDRYQRPVFDTYFNGALESGGAFLITDTATSAPIGCTRFYDHDTVLREIKIGYTFFARSCWGRPFNSATKKLMLDHAFTFVDTVLFHVGAKNLRSRKAMEKLGARLFKEVEVAYYGEAVRTNVEYHMTRELWQQLQQKQ